MVESFGKPGWFDEVGPLHFLRDRWACGPRWRPCWARFYVGSGGITLQAHSKRGCYALAGLFVRADLWSDLSYAQKEDVVMSWIKEVRRPDNGGIGRPAAADPDWLRELPAIHDYCTAAVAPDGSVRRTATLTIFAEHGSWKCYLNDRHTGASLCATSDTVANALCALEVMLEGEDPPWRFSEAPAPSRGRKSGKGS